MRFQSAPHPKMEEVCPAGADAKTADGLEERQKRYIYIYYIYETDTKNNLMIDREIIGKVGLSASLVGNIYNVFWAEGWKMCAERVSINELEINLMGEWNVYVVFGKGHRPAANIYGICAASSVYMRHIVCVLAIFAII